MSKKIYITESQYNSLIGEMAYPSSFSFDEFKKLKSFAERIKYCDQRLQRISSGSSRIVYNIDDIKVLKLAKNERGLAQNQTEIRLGTEPYYTCFAKIYDYSDDGMWVEMECCRKAYKSDFKKLYGIPFDALCCAISKMANFRWTYCDQYSGIVNEIWNGDESKIQDLFNSINDYISCEGLNFVKDLFRISSWGLSKDTNRFVIIDFGLDDEVYNNYYRRH